MKIKSIAQFRQYIKKTAGRENDKYTDENFVGSYYQNNQELIKGFFEIYHGKKPDIAKYLRATAVNIAADEQAIYEFMQNAVDCGSSHFFIFYNDDYFLAINNGSQFKTVEIEAVLNLGQSQKGNAEIGSYGIGFKIVHRLVGQNDGVDELTKEYKGPILFSWSNLNDFKTLLKKQELEPIGTNSNLYENAPWLFKILLTNFPTEPNETIKDQSYTNSNILFTQAELNELIDFVNLNLKNHKNLNYNILNQGSLFFLKLGKGKRKYLDNNRKELERGVGYSLNTLRNLQKVYINETAVGKPTLQLITDIFIKKGTDEFIEISPENTQRDINIIFGYYADFEKSKEILSAPNFYNFFPMESEVNEFRFIIHCNAFDNRANRRELHKSEINERLLSHIIKKILNRLSEYKNTDRDKFLQIYVSFLLSKIPQEDTKWLLEPFFNHILMYLRENIPTINFYKDNPENVIIKRTDLNVTLSDFGIKDKEWFYYNDIAITFEARKEDKLELKAWTIIELLYFGEIKDINDWLKINAKLIPRILKEINNNWHTRSDYKDFADKFKEIKLFKFDGADELLSLSEIVANDEYLFLFDKISDIKAELQEIGFKISEINISDFSKQGNNNFETSLRGFVKLNNFDALFERINSFSSKKTLQNTHSKNKLFSALVSDPKDFINSKHFANITIFQNQKGDLLPLNELIVNSEVLKENKWLQLFAIENINDLNNLALISSYSCKVEQVFSKIIYPNWKFITDKLTETSELPNNFYKNIIDFYNKRTDKNEHKRFSANNVDYIWTGSSFVKHEKVVFSQYFQNANIDFSCLNSILKKWLGLFIPDLSIMEYLNKLPFETNTIKQLQTDKYSSENFTSCEIIELLKWNKEESLQFFKHYIITEEQDNFNIHLRANNNSQYFSIDAKIVEFFKEYPNYILLPKVFETYKTDDILSNSKLYNEIIDLIDFENITQNTFKIFSNAELKEQDIFIANLSEIRINIANLPDSNSYEFHLLQFACLIHEDNIGSIQSKIAIETEHDEFTLEGQTIQTDTLKIGQFELSLSKLLLLDISDKSNAIQKTIEHFTKLKISEERLNKLFNVKSEINYEMINNKINETISNGKNVCKNAEQLVYCLLTNYKDAEVEMKDGAPYKLFDYYAYCPETPFLYINNNSILSDNYIGITEKLNLNSEKPNYFLNDKAEILYIPYFNKNKFICQYFEYKPDDADIEDKRIYLLNELYKNYLSIKTAYKEIETDINLSDLLGIELSKTIYPNDYAVENEKTPEWLVEWINNDNDKIKLLAALGLHTLEFPENSIVKYRKYLSGTINEVYKKQENNFYFKNTLSWLFENLVEINEKQANNLQIIYQNIPVDLKNPFTVYKVFSNTFEIHELSTNDYFINQIKLNEITNLKINVNDIYEIIIKQQNGDLTCDLIPAYSNFFPLNYINFIENNLTKIEIFEPLPDEENILNCSEWNIDFYNDIKADLNYSIHLVNGDIPVKWTFLGEPIKKDVEAKIAIGADKIYINKTIYNTPEQILNLIKSQTILSDLYSELFEQKNQVALKIGNKLVNLGISESDIDLNKISTKKSEEELKNNLINAKDYTFNWYVSFLEILHYYSDNQNSNKGREIKFERVIIDNTIEKLVHLENTNNFIPYFIENADRIELYIQTQTERKELKIRGISVKTNQIDALLNEPLSIKISDIKYAILKVSNTIDLLKEIKNAFKLLNYPPDYCLQTNLPKDIQFIFGPPGTGKTTTLATTISGNYINKVIGLIETNNRIIVLTPTNKAADVLTEKIMNYCKANNIDYSWLIRYGNTLSELIVEEGIQKTGIDDLAYYDKFVMITTIARFPYDKYFKIVNGEEQKIQLRYTKWDYVIFDEASMIAQFYIVHAIYQSFKVNENCKYIVAGDPFQIPPVVTIPDVPETVEILERIKEENIYTLVNLNSFNPKNQITVPHSFSILNLNIQYRSLIPIGELFNHFTYEGYIQQHTRGNLPNKVIPLTVKNKKFNPINLIRFKVNSDDTVFRPGRINYSGYHPYSALLLAEFINNIASSLEGAWNIGVVCLHKTQAKLIKNLLISFDLFKINPEIQITTDTVHGFQGDEYDIVFCVFSPAMDNDQEKYQVPSILHYLGKKNFYHKKNILNVAISRAKDYLFIMVPDDNTTNIQNFVYWTELQNIMNRLQIQFTDFKHTDIEKHIFNEQNHIENHSLKTEHQIVNIYSKPFIEYFVTTSDVAVDIQIKK